MPKKDKKKREDVNFCDYIDTSIFLGYMFEQGDSCKEYLDVVGYKSHNIGVISHHVMSEILINLLLKVKLDDHIKEEYAKERAFKLLDLTITKLREKGRLKILKLTSRIVDPELFEELQSQDTGLSDDDAFHLIEAIKERCQFFATTDEEIIQNKKLREYLVKNYNLKIKEIKLK